MDVLSNHVRIARRFQRSINIGTDLDDLSSLEGFVCPKSSSDALLLMAKHITESKQGAFTWTGPYGSGKSSLVVALGALLGPDKRKQDLAIKAIGKDVATEIIKLLPPKSDGWKILPVIGRRADPEEVIWEALERSEWNSQRYREEKTGDHSLINELNNIAGIKPDNSGGLIIFVDEMGKFLEEVAKGSLDVYFFQLLAEAASRSNGRLIVIGILHQSFEEYASRLSRSIRDEWTKIHGRFTDLPINTAGEEQIELIARAVTNDTGNSVDQDQIKAIGKCIRTNRPLVANSFEDRLAMCWPLHPVVSCLLGPISRRRFGQNQRSIFGFLNSAEPHGFQDFLKSTPTHLESLFWPAQLWDYLRINLEPAILASPDGHRWSLAVEAVERCEALSGELTHIELAKCVALIDLFKERSGISASYDLLSSCVKDYTTEQIKSILDDLINLNVVIYKKYMDSFAIFAGSDFDIEQALTDLRDDNQEIDFRVLRSISQLQPIVAKSFYHTTGALYWFEVDITPVSEALTKIDLFEPRSASIGQFLLIIPTAGETVQLAEQTCQSAVLKTTKWPTIVGLADNSSVLRSLVLDLMCLEKIQIASPELEGDPVARREVNARITDLSSQLEEEIKKSFGTAIWHVPGVDNPISVESSGLSVIASNVARRLFDKAPFIPNELINRLKPSSNSIAAQKTLLRHMVNNNGQDRLGIVGFPAEGGLYKSLLESTGLYCQNETSWRFVYPSEGDRSRLFPLWVEARKILENNSQSTVSLGEVYKVWSSPPFGIKSGLMPILGVAFILSNHNNIATYLDGTFRATFDDYVVDCLTQDPNRLELRWMNLSQISLQILTGMAVLVKEIEATEHDIATEPIEVARRLVAVVDKLPNWTQRTLQLTPNAKRIRDLFKQAHDPNKFLFDDIPALFKIESNSINDESIVKIIELVGNGLKELIDAYPTMINNMQMQMLTELNFSLTAINNFSELHERAENIKQLTGNFRLDAFITRLASFSGKLDEIEGVASLAANKPPRDWLDRDVDAAMIEVADLAQQFNRAEAFARVKGRPDKRHSVAIVIGMPNRPSPVHKEFDISTSEKNAVLKLAKQISNLIAGSNIKSEIALAAIAEAGAHVIRGTLEN